VKVFYEKEQAPVHSVLLLPTREEALSYPTGTVRLGFCQQCAFVYNVAFDPDLQHEYSTRYEETQGYSPTFNAFATRLANRLIERYNLHEKNIIEIGCGKGEFITQLCQMGNNQGIGIDPAYVRDRSLAAPDERVSFITDFYSETHAALPCDFLCCKMTLEHIDQTADFVGIVARSTREKTDIPIFFQIPNATYVFRDVAFWDIYYEHCSYFSAGSLARLFRSQGFDVLDLGIDYGDQYLMIEARPAAGNDRRFPELEDDIEQMAQYVDAFPARFQEKATYWQNTMQRVQEQGQRAVLWGSGSKGVAFLTTLGIRDAIQYTVDINPNKHGTYMAGTGQEIVGPAFLTDYKPDLVIVMNPVYKEEIQRDLQNMGLSPEVVTV
jgi:2-polyprenyl-3-methyl-5-hydroxy-6-metoxy-1,4-benzoquinol methylase